MGVTVMRDIIGYEGLYKVSSAGEIFSYYTNKLLKHNINHNGYASVELFKNGKSKRCLVHRLVAQTLIPNPNNYPQVNHKDENPLNNKVENLEWCTARYNMNYGNGAKTRHLKIDYTKPIYRENAFKNAMKVRKPVLGVNKTTNEVVTFVSAAEAQRIIGVNASHIAECCKGKRYKSVGGFTWKYIERE